MTKIVTVDQIQIINIPRDIAFQIPSASVFLQSTEVSYKSNYTKRLTISSHSIEIINKLKEDLHNNKETLQAIKTFKQQQQHKSSYSYSGCSCTTNQYYIPFRCYSTCHQIIIHYV